jgi:methionyl-tRNA formyltransferase
MAKLDIVAIGGTARAVNTLDMLLRHPAVNVAYGIFMPGYDNETIYMEQLVALAETRGIPYSATNDITEDVLKRTMELRADAMIGIGVWRSILSPDFLNATRLGFFGLHGTPLPRYRGFAGINWQIINGEKTVGMSMLRVNEGIDAGSLVAREDGSLLEYHINIENEKHLAEVFDEYEVIHIQALDELLHLLATNRYRLVEQDHSKASYACHRGPDDGEVNWNQPTATVFNFIRAQSRPYGGAFTYFNGRRVTLWRVRPRPDYANYEGRIPGKVVTRDKATGSVVVLTADGGIEILDAQTDEVEESSPYRIFNSVRKRCQSRVEAFIERQGTLSLTNFR